jgi:hypothetical protein
VLDIAVMDVEVFYDLGTWFFYSLPSRGCGIVEQNNLWDNPISNFCLRGNHM